MIHQIFISEMTDPKEQEQLDLNKKRFLEVFPDEEYRLWREKDIQLFLIKEYPAILKEFNLLTAYSAKADLAKVVIINHFGGWYYDFYTEPILKVDTSYLDMIIFRDIQKNSSTSFAVAMNVFYSIKNNPVLSTAIDLIIHNIRTKHYGQNPLCPTSVVPFGRAIAIHGDNPRHSIGDYLDFEGRKSCKLSDGPVVAYGKQLAGGHIDLAGTNNYNELWRDRNFYGEKLDK